MTTPLSNAQFDRLPRYAQDRIRSLADENENLKQELAALKDDLGNDEGRFGYVLSGTLETRPLPAATRGLKIRSGLGRTGILEISLRAGEYGTVQVRGQNPLSVHPEAHNAFTITEREI